MTWTNVLKPMEPSVLSAGGGEVLGILAAITKSTLTPSVTGGWGGVTKPSASSWTSISKPTSSVWTAVTKPST